MRKLKPRLSSAPPVASMSISHLDNNYDVKSTCKNVAKSAAKYSWSMMPV